MDVPLDIIAMRALRKNAQRDCALSIDRKHPAALNLTHKAPVSKRYAWKIRVLINRIVLHGWFLPLCGMLRRVVTSICASKTEIRPGLALGGERAHANQEGLCGLSLKIKGGTVSRVLYRQGGPGRPLSFIWAAYPPAKDEQPLTAGIFGLAGRRRILRWCRHRTDAGSYPAFSPLPLPREGRLFSVPSVMHLFSGFLDFRTRQHLP